MNVHSTLRKALSQLEADRKQIDQQIAAIRGVLGSSPGTPKKKASTTRAKRSKRRMSASARKAVSRRMKAYWASKKRAAKKSSKS